MTKKLALSCENLEAPDPFSKVKKKSVTIASQMYPLIKKHINTLKEMAESALYKAKKCAHI